MTKYLIGPIIFVHVALLIGILLFGSYDSRLTLQQYFIHLTPLAFLDSFIRGLALRKWRHPTVKSESLWRAIVITFATWPAYTLAWIMAVLRVPVSFRPTPKSQAGRVNPLWLAPQLISVALLITGLLYTRAHAPDNISLGLLYAIAIGFIIPQLGLLRPLLRPLVRSILSSDKRTFSDSKTVSAGSVVRERLSPKR
jgi:hypothetical protein